MDKAKALEKIIEALMEFAIPSMNPDDFDTLDRITKDLIKQYRKD